MSAAQGTGAVAYGGHPEPGGQSTHTPCPPLLYRCGGQVHSASVAELGGAKGRCAGHGCCVALPPGQYAEEAWAVQWQGMQACVAQDARGRPGSCTSSPHCTVVGGHTHPPMEPAPPTPVDVDAGHGAHGSPATPVAYAPDGHWLAVHAPMDSAPKVGLDVEGGHGKLERPSGQ